MATIDYEKKYKALVEAVKTLKEANPSDEGIQNWVKDNVPELKESEDERIRKALLEMVHDTTGDILWVDYNVHKEDAIAWLEKQGGQKLAVEMKTPEESLGIDSDTYNKIVDECIFGEQKSTVWSKEDELHIRELERLVKQEWATAECENDKDKIHKMSDLSFFLKTLKPQLKQEWSEEDEEKMVSIFLGIETFCPSIIYGNDKEELLSWFKSIKDRVQPQPKQEWSKEDETMLNSFQHKLEVCDLLSTKEIIWIRNKLKSLRP